MKKVLSFMKLMLIVSVSFAQLNNAKPYNRSQSDVRYERYLGNPSVSGYVLSSTTSGVRTWIANGSGGSMIYPSAGIPLSTGSAWGTSITNNSANWNTAYGWGNWAANFGTTTGTITEGNDPRLIGNVKTDDLVDPSSLIDSISNTRVVPMVDGTANGNITSSFNCGYSSSAIGDLVYLNSSSTWQKCDKGTSVATYSGLLGIALEVKASGNSLKVALPGSMVYATGFPSLTVGSPVYMDDAGAIVVTQPVTANKAIRVIGWAVHADKIFFYPSPDYIIHN